MSFMQIKGQNFAVNLLRSNIKQANVHGAYLFAGPAGSGRFTTAMQFAKALNCRERPDDACGRCPNCKRIDEGNFPDIHVVERLDNKTTITVEQVRQIRKTVYVKAYEGPYKVYVITNAEDLGLQGANALLKVLEEPPAKTVFILIATRQGALLPTITSRTRIVRFQPLDADIITEILTGEGLGEAGALKVLARQAQGSCARARNLVDNDYLSLRDEALQLIAGRIDDRSELFDCTREELQLFMEIVQNLYRDILLLATGASERQLVNADIHKNLSEFSGDIAVDELERLLERTLQAARGLAQNLNQKLVLTDLICAVRYGIATTSGGSLR